MVLQEPNLFNALVLQNVTYGRRMSAIWRERTRRQGSYPVGDGTMPDTTREAPQEGALVIKHSQNALSLFCSEAQWFV